MADKKTLAELEAVGADSEARKKLAAFFDEESFIELGKFNTLRETSSIVTGYGLIDGACVYAFADDEKVKSGAVDAYAAEKLQKLYAMAVKNGSPVVGFYSTKGGKIDEGAKLIKAYSDIIASSAALSGTVPQISVVDGVCPGITATLACMSDFVIMTEKSELFLTAPFNAEITAEGAGSAENAAKAGVAAVIANDSDDAIEKAKSLIKILPQNNLEPSGNDYYTENDAEVTAELKKLDMVKAIADGNSVIELYPAYGKNVTVSLASVNWRTVGFVTLSDELSADDSAKAARFVGFCDSFSIPVVTIVDTNGFAPDSAAELSGAIQSSAKLAQTYASATTPKINLITGNAIGSSFIAVNSADITLAFEYANVSPVAPNTAAVFLTPEKLKGMSVEDAAREYGQTEGSAFNGIADRVIDPSETRTAIASALDITSGKRVIAPSKKHVNFVF